MINEIIHRVCPVTVMTNGVAIGISFTSIEAIFKILSYTVAIIWTLLKIRAEIKFYNSKNAKKD